MTFIKIFILSLVSFNSFAYQITSTSVSAGGITRYMWQVRCNDGVHWTAYSSQDEAKKNAASFCKSHGSGFAVSPTSPTRTPVQYDLDPATFSAPIQNFDSRSSFSSF
jgi:hypothetical protein